MKILNNINLFFIISVIFILFGCGAAANKTTPLLIQDLNNSDREVRLTAVWILSKRGAIAVPALIESLNDPDKGVRYASMWSLHNIGSIEAYNALNNMIPMLENDLRDIDPKSRETAADFLKMIDTQEAKIILEQYKEEE